MNTLTFLKPKLGAATKSFIYQENKWSLASDYQMGRSFKGVEIDVNNLEESYQQIKKKAEEGYFLISGKLLTEQTQKEC